MKVWIITIGDEILIGQILNTNAGYIGQKLTENSISVLKTTVVGDVKEDIINEFSLAMNSADVVIVTGGLGPTHDDITKNCICEFFNTELIMNEEVLQDVKDIFEKRNRIMAKINETQALVPKNAKVIRNYKGTAPGLWIERNNKIFVSMPGVPFEMKNMVDDYILPELIKRNRSGEILRIKNIMTTGIAESTLFEKLGNLDALLNGAKMAFLPSQYGVKLRINTIADSEEKANEHLFEIEQKIRLLAGRYVYSNKEESIEEVIARLMTERDLTLSVAESCTGGLICNRLTNFSGSSHFLERGVVVYSNGAKVELLEVQEETLDKFGAVSMETAREMAAGIKSASGTDIGLAVTGIMGPTGGSEEKPVGTVFIGLCNDNVCTARHYRFGDGRILNKERTSQAALDILRRHILGISYDE